MTTTARELAEEIIINNNKYGTHPVYGQNAIELENAITIAIEQAHQRGRESVLDNFPSALDMWSLAMQCKKAAEQEPMGDVKLFRLKLLAKLKEPT